jgi:hypothetical protein
MVQLAYLVALAWLAAGVAASAAEVLSGTDDLVIRDARLIDGTGAPPQEHVLIRVHKGQIAEICGGSSGERLPERLRRSDLGAEPSTPALVSGVRGDDGAGRRVFPSVAREIQSWLAAGHPGPRDLTTGPYLRVPNGYGDERFGSEATPADVERKLDLIESLGGVGVKIAIERGTRPLTHRSLSSRNPQGGARTPVTG